jgi:hypothetical protein
VDDKAAARQRARNLMYFARPVLWPTWPFLPLVRRRHRMPVECGLLYDAYRMSGRTGYSATVFLVNLFCVPAAEEVLLTLPKEVYDRPEEIFDALWRID